MNKQRGFSLVELLVCLFLTGILALLAVQSWKGKSGAEQALAQELAARVRAVRQHALARHMRCALVLPENPASSLTQAEGQVRARLTGSRGWAGEYRGTLVQTGAGEADAATSAWLGELSRRPCLAFDGQGRPCASRELQIIGSESWLLEIGPEGRVDIRRSPTRLALRNQPLGAVLRAFRAENRPPTVQSLLHAPKVHSSMLNGQTQAIVPYGGALQLTVKAEDPDGDQLFVRWSSPDGIFSCPDEQPMHFEDGRWIAECQYRPQIYDPGQAHKIVCHVRDEHGLEADSGAAQQLQVAIGLRGTFAFWGSDSRDPDGDIGLWTSTPEGHRVRRVLPKVGDYAALSPDGEKIAYGDRGEGVWVANADGSDPQKYFGASVSNAAFSPNGAFLAAFLMSEEGPRKLLVCRATGDEILRLDLPDNTVPVAVWDADNIHVYVQYQWEGESTAVFNDSEGVASVSASTRVRRIRTRGEGEAYTDLNWPQEVGNILFPSPRLGEVRGADPNGTMYAFRADSPGEARVVRSWVGTGFFRTPSVGSPYEVQTMMMEGWRLNEEGEIERSPAGAERFRGYSLWRRGEEAQRRLLLPGVVPKPCVPGWSE